MADQSPGDAAWGAVADSAAQRGGGTSQADIDAYAEAAGGAAAGAACAAYGAAAAAPVCAYIGGKVAGLVADAIQSLGSAIFGAPSEPDAADVFNPIADRVIAMLVLQAQDKPHTKADVHALGESGIRKLAGRRSDGSATDSLWLQIAAKWATAANAFGEAHSSRRSGTAIQWWYESGPKAGRIRGAVADVYGNGPADRQDISASVVAASADTSSWIAASHVEKTRGGDRLVPNSSGSGIGKLVTFGLLIFGGYEVYKHRKAIKKALR